MAAGVAASVILGVLLAPVTLCVPYAGAHEPAMEGWRPRARKAWPLIAAANALLSLGAVTALAAPLIPWSLDVNDYTGVTMPRYIWFLGSYGCSYGGYSCSGTMANVYLLGGSITVFLGLILCLIAWGLGLCAGARVRGVAVHGAPAGVGCCAPSMPAIQGLLWTGFLCVLSGAASMWSLNAIVLAVFHFKKPSPGGALLGLSALCLFTAAVLYSVVGCCTLGPLPGVGTSASNCCCVERNRHLQPPPAAGCCGSSGAVAADMQIRTPAPSVQFYPPPPGIADNKDPLPPGSSSYPSRQMHCRVSLEVSESGPLGVDFDARAGSGLFYVRSLTAGGLGERAGLRLGDELVAMRGASTQGWDRNAIVAQFRGPRPLALEVLREVPAHFV